MEHETSARFIKHLLFLQVLILLGIGICEILQLAEINKSQQQIIEHPDDWNYLFGYTNKASIIVMKIYYWIVIFITFGVLGWSLDTFERRWKDIQNYSDNPSNVMLLILWCLAAIPNVIMSSLSGRLGSCTESDYSYTVSERLLRHCNSYLASLALAYVLIFTFIIQILFNFAIIKRKKEVDITPPPIIQEPVKLKVKRSQRVKKKRNSLISVSAISTGTRLSIVTEDEEEGSNKSVKSDKSRSVKSLMSSQTVDDTRSENEFISREVQHYILNFNID